MNRHKIYSNAMFIIEKLSITWIIFYIGCVSYIERTCVLYNNRSIGDELHYLFLCQNEQIQRLRVTCISYHFHSIIKVANFFYEYCNIIQNRFTAN
jgi:hypothetical protein